MIEPEVGSADALETVLSYHERTKHQPQRYARSLGYLDWRTQPDPFRLYEDAPGLLLDEIEPGAEPLFDDVFVPGRIVPRPVDRASISQLFYDSLALSAWKEFQGSRWALRVNPSSGNLHPTEGYLITGGVPGLLDGPALCHYSPFLHALEVRTEMSPGEWSALSAGLPRRAVLVGLSSIAWRESWKYGERAFRYCHHDVGHAVAAMAVAASVLGWEARLLEGCTDPDLSALLGVGAQTGPEAEHPDCLLALYPAEESLEPEIQRAWRPPRDLLQRLAAAKLQGTPNRLSSEHHPWPVIDAASEATQRAIPPGEAFWHGGPRPVVGLEAAARPLPARKILRQRRSAVAMDGTTALDREVFLRMLQRLLPAAGRPPFAALPWKPSLHLVLFVHRVRGLDPGVYILPRRADALAELRAAIRGKFEWRAVEGCPEGVDLRLLLEDDAREAAQLIACNQEIASDGAFAVGMLAEHEGPLRQHGPWMYRRLHWEAGAIGQILYLEAEAAGARGTGIGCFFDDLMHRLLGISGRAYQSLYHFTVGGPVEDERLRTIPAYAHRTAESR